MKGTGIGLAHARFGLAPVDRASLKITLILGKNRNLDGGGFLHVSEAFRIYQSPSLGTTCLGVTNTHYLR